MDELERLQKGINEVPDRNLPSQEELGKAQEEFLTDDLNDFNDEKDDLDADIMNNREVVDIIKEYSHEDGTLNVDKLLIEIDKNPGTFTIFPFALKESELIEFKNRLQNEQRKRKAADQEGDRGDNQAPVQNTEKDTDGGDQGDETRTGPEEREQLTSTVRISGRNWPNG